MAGIVVLQQPVLQQPLLQQLENYKVSVCELGRCLDNYIDIVT